MKLKYLYLVVAAYILGITISTYSQGQNYIAGQVLTKGATLPNTCAESDLYILNTGTVGIYICTPANVWQNLNPYAYVPPGLVTMVIAGTCPAGFAEVSALNGKMLRGTITANGDVGTSAGADSITPTVSSLTSAAQTFTGNSITSSAVSAGTPAGTNGTVSITPLLNAIAWPAGVPTNANESAHTHSVTAAGTNTATATTGNCAATNVLIGTGAANACKATAPNLTVPAETFTGSSVTSGAGSSHTHTISWPAGVPTITGASTTVGAETFTGSALGTHTHTTTATGTNGTSAVTGTLNSFNNRPAYTNVIFCSKN